MAGLGGRFILLLVVAAGCGGAAVPDRAASRPGPPPARHAARSDPPPLNVRDFGAGDCGEGSDAPAINRAIRAAGETGNRFVYIPPGEYRIRQEPGQGVLDAPIRPEVDG